MSDFDRAKNLLIGAVDTVLSLATQANPTVRTPSTREGQAGSSSGRSQSTTCTSKRPAVPVKSEEHRRLFGYKPTKGKRPKKAASTTRRKGCGAVGLYPKRRRCSSMVALLTGTAGRLEVHVVDCDLPDELPACPSRVEGVRTVGLA